MSRLPRGRSSTPKEAIPNESYDPRIKVIDDVKGKTKQVKLLDLDLMDQVLFPQMDINVFWGLEEDSIGRMQFVPKLDFIDLFNSTIMHLMDLPFFGTTGEVVWCTKFLISRVHDMSLWLEKIYMIHADDIKQLRGLSLEGEDVSKGFQGPSKHGKRKGKFNMFEKFHTQRGGHTMKIEPIIPKMVWTSCYVIASKVMCSYYKGECTLDSLSVENFYTNGAMFNW
jgi:hypothetical protein